MKEIPLSKGYVALVDDEDFDALNAFKWCYSPGGAIRSLGRVGGRVRTVFMHRVLCGASISMRVIHLDGNRFNNQQGNLKLMTIGEMRRRSATKNKSGFKGVHPMHNRFMAKIALNGKSVYLGTFTTAADAARAYDRKLVEYYGDSVAKQALNEFVTQECRDVPDSDRSPEPQDIQPPHCGDGSEGVRQDHL